MSDERTTDTAPADPWAWLRTAIARAGAQSISVPQDRLAALLNERDAFAEDLETQEQENAILTARLAMPESERLRTTEEAQRSQIAAGAINYDALDPGIRDVVRRVREAGFETVDSGDGVSKPPVGRTFEIPHVICESNVNRLVDEAIRLQALLGDSWQVETSFAPKDGKAFLMAFQYETHGIQCGSEYDQLRDEVARLRELLVRWLGSPVVNGHVAAAPELVLDTAHAVNTERV